MKLRSKARMLRCCPPPSLLFPCPAAYMSAHANQCPVSDGPHRRQHTHLRTDLEYRLFLFFKAENEVFTVIVSECCVDWRQRRHWNAPIRDHCEITPFLSRYGSWGRCFIRDVSDWYIRDWLFSVCIYLPGAYSCKLCFLLLYYFPCQHYWFAYVLMGIISGLLLLFWKDKCYWWLFTVYIFQPSWGWGIFAVTVLHRCANFRWRAGSERQNVKQQSSFNENSVEPYVWERCQTKYSNVLKLVHIGLKIMINQTIIMIYLLASE